MSKADDLRATLRRLPEMYASGDFEGYIEHYAPDLTSYFEGVVSNHDEACSFIRSMFEGGGKTLEFHTGDRTRVMFNESEDAATLCYPWREKFRFADGRVTDTDYHQTEVWFRRDGRWKIVHVHLTVVRENQIKD